VKKQYVSQTITVDAKWTGRRHLVIHSYHVISNTVNFKW